MNYVFGVSLALALAAVSAFSQSSIRKVDFKNFQYRLSCGTADARSGVTVKNGEFKGLKRGVDVSLKIYEVKFGDLNKDGRDEALVLYACGSGASYVYFRGLVFTLRGNRPILMTEVEGGNKGNGGFYEVRFARDVLVVERYQLGTAGSPCCPEFIETTKYRWNGKGLVQTGKPTVRRIPANNS